MTASVLTASRPPPLDGPTAFSFGSSRVGDVVLIDVTGEIDMATGPAFARAIGLDTGPKRLVVVNLSEIGFVDSTALNTLVHSWQSLAAEASALYAPATPASAVAIFVFAGCAYAVAFSFLTVPAAVV